MVKPGSKEFAELQEFFEKQVLNYIAVYGKTVERDGSVRGQWYTNGEINNLFKAFLAGYEYHKVISK